MKGDTLRITLLIFFILILSGGLTQAQNPFIPKYDAVKRSERCFTVTYSNNNQFGSVWWADKVDFSQDTTFNFVVYMGSRDSNGADGLAFVIHQDPRDTITNSSETVIIDGGGTWDLSAATGDDGGGLGYAMHTSRVGPNTIPGPHGPGDDAENHKIQRSVAVEIDTWNNGDVPDGKNGNDANGVYQSTSPFYGWDHTSVVYNGDLYGGQQQITDAIGNTDRILPLKPSYVFGTANNSDGTAFNNIEDDKCYTFQIRWEVNSDGTQNLQLWADIYNGTTDTNNLQMIMNHTDDMINKVFSGNTLMRFGFTGSTGGAINEQTICLLGENLSPFAADDYVSLPVNSSKVIDVESNDNDPDNDQLHVPVIIDYPFHGEAVIFDSLDVNFLRYTPDKDYVGKDSLTYVTCDVNSTKCYAKCDTAYVFIRVGCEPFDIEATPISANVVCSDSVPSNGSASALAYLNTIVWYEGFEDLSNNTTIDNGASGWSFSKSGNCTSNGDIIRVDTEQGVKVFRVQNSGCEVEWKTHEIDISAYKDKGVDVTLNVWEKGRMENDDYLKVYYKLDGGPLTEFGNGIHENDIAGVKTPYINDIIGDKLEIIILVKNNSGNEEHFWDNLKIKGEGSTVAGVEFNWYEGIRPTSTPVYTGSTANGLNDGVYTIIATDITTGCFSNPINITIDSAGYNVTGGFIEQMAPFTNCALPYDGALAAGIVNGTDTIINGYTFEWYHQEDPKIQSFIQRTGPDALNLESREYSVIITDNTTGCDTTINGEVVNEVIIPTVNASTTSHVISCTDPNTGAAQATVGGNTTGYDFEWYAGPAIGAGPPDYTTASVNTLAPGIYTVQAIDNSTACTSVSTSVSVIDQSVTPELEVTVNTEQTSCDPLNPTGDLSGVVIESGIPTTSGYSFYWYKGPNDIVPAKSGYSGGPNVNGLDASVYRLVAIADGTNCTSYVDTLIQDQTLTPPDITLSKVDVTHCGTANGSISIAVTGNPTDFNYELYTGFGVVSDSLLQSTTNTSITGLPIGNYTVIAIDKITKCATNPATITINDVTVSPTASFSLLDQISCDPANPTGQITTVPDLLNAADYTYQWYTTSIDPANLMGSTGSVLSDLAANTYALRFKSIASECSSDYTITVNDGIVIPVVAATPTASTTCDTKVNGMIDAQAVGIAAPFAGYTFNWLKPSDAAWSATGINIANLAPDDYTVTVTEDATGCVSAALTVTVGDSRILPTASFSLLDQISCDPANPMGQITTVPDAGVVADYEYAWFVTDFTTPQLGTTGEVLSNLAAGPYALRFKSIASECSSDYTITVNDGIVIPVVAATPTASTFCSTNVNGQIDASVNGVAAPYIGYTFNWLKPSDAAWSATGTNIANLAPDDYTVTVTEDLTTCASTSYAITVDDNSVTPNPTVSIVHNSSCDGTNPNGDIMISDVSNKGVYSFPGDFDFAWYDGNSSGPPFITVPVSSPQISDLKEGTVALVITNSTTLCSNEVLSEVNKIDIFPSIDVVNVTDVSRCVEPFLSTATVPSVTDPVSALFTYQWTNLDGGPAISGIGSTIADTDPLHTDETLPSGNYQVIVTNEFNCSSAPVTFEIKDLSVPPAFDVFSYNNISCDPANPVGILVAQRPDESYTISNYEWFTNAPLVGNEILPAIPATDSIHYDLGAGNYAVRITDAATACTSVDYASILDIQANDPIIDTVYTKALTKCIGPDGELGLKVVALEQIPPIFTQNRTYTFNITNAPDVFNLTTDPVSASPDTVAFVNLGSGNWISTVEDDFTHCVSAPLSINLSEAPGVVLTRLDSILPADCDGIAMGSFQFQASSANNPALVFPTPANPGADLGFSFDWEYKGTQFTGPDNATPGIVDVAKTDGFREWRDNLLAGYYIIKATDYFSDCVASDTFYIPVADAPPSVATIGQDAQDCIPGNGRIDFQVNGTASHGAVGDYNVILYSGTTTDIANLKRSEPLLGSYGDFFSFGTGGPGIDYPEPLPPGDYTIVTQEKVAPFCLSEPTVVTVGLDLTDPTIAATSITDDFSCRPGTGTGAISALATDNDDLDNSFNYEWYTGTEATGISFSNLANISNLEAGIFTVKVTDINGRGNGCSYEQTFNLPKTLKNITLDSLIAHNDNCAPFNGSAQILNIYEDGVDVGVLPGVYHNFSILYDPATLAKPANNTAAAFTALDPGEYYLRAQNSTTDCYTETQIITIEDNSVKPDINIVANSQDFGCTLASANGDLAADIGGLTAGYNFNWYRGAIAAPNLVINASNANGLSANNTSQLYTIEVEDTDGADGSLGCISSKEYILIHQPTSVTILSSDITRTDQTICGPNGSILLNQIMEDDGSGPPVPINPDFSVAGFDARLLDQTLTPINPVVNPYATFVPLTGTIGSGNIPAGTYYVQASKLSTGCGFGPVTQVIINDVSVDPIINVVMESPDFACAGTNFTGVLAPTITGGSDGDPIQGNYLYNWTSVATGVATAVDAANKANTLEPGDYRLVVTDNAGPDAGCTTTQDFTVTSARHNIDIIATPTDQTVCGPNGEVIVSSIMEYTNGIAEPNPGWNVSLLDAGYNPLIGYAPLGAGVNAITYANRAATTYYVKAQDIFTQCESDPFEVIINDVSVDPEIDVNVVTPQYSLNPNPASWTGQLNASSIETNTGLPDPLGYTYSWHQGLDTTTPSIGAIDSIMGLGIGDYTVVARSMSTNCESSVSHYVPFEYLEPTFNTFPRPKTVCSPDNGSIEVTDIALAGNADLLSDYTFNWHHDVYSTGDTPDAIIPGNDTQTIYTNLKDGSYYTIAFENWLMVESLPVKIEVTDSSSNPIIVFDATNYNPLTSCDETQFADGQLAVDVYEDTSNPYLAPPPYNYNYTWYAGQNANPANVIAGEISNIISSLPTGDYTVSVVNRGNNCQTESTFSIEDESITPIVIASQMANTNCPIELANGITSASVINSENGHVYRWYEGTEAIGNYVFEGAVWEDRGVGFYTVVAVDQNFGTCVSAPVIVEVKDATEQPTVLINEVAPITHCDPNRPNGVLSAVTQDGIFGHTFEWYLDDQLYFTGPVASNLGHQEYTLVVTNDVTQCETSMTSQPSQLFSIVPSPEVEILSERTSCNEADGIVTASIEGSVTDHIFKYYNLNNGNEVTNYYNDYKLYDLDTTSYFVIAEDRTTGCISDSTVFAISDETYFPEIEIITEASNCEEATGTADVIISDVTRDYKVYWRGDNGFEAQQKELVYIPLGFYTVDVEGSDGCITTLETEVKGDVKIFNGVTPNNDGMNDYFKIVCLENFPTNNVKIYNRAGLMVYEQNGYNIYSDKRFEGISNRGVSIIGKELPIGTYFYVVDKNDGSKATVGYLELKR